MQFVKEYKYKNAAQGERLYKLLSPLTEQR